MINDGAYNVLGVRIDAVDYEQAVEMVVTAAQRGDPCSVSALAVHGVMTGVADPVHRRRLNGLDLVVPDGQPVRWALKWLHGVSLPDRVYGPTLTLHVLEAAAREELPVYFYGSTAETVARLVDRVSARLPGLRVAGYEPSQFRRLDRDGMDDVVGRIKDSGARIVFVGLGCPRQEVWAFEYRDQLSMPILAVGAAFDFHAGTLPQAPAWMQGRGLEWLFRLYQEPGRLWRRYLKMNPAYLARVALQKLGLKRAPLVPPNGTEPVESYG
ncbi:MAG: WecB/TagA/CpsF family glycosyltransferase [Acidimicrobiia bacterium]